MSGILEGPYTKIALWAGISHLLLAGLGIGLAYLFDERKIEGINKIGRLLEPGGITELGKTPRLSTEKSASLAQPKEVQVTFEPASATMWSAQVYSGRSLPKARQHAKMVRERYPESLAGRDPIVRVLEINGARHYRVVVPFADRDQWASFCLSYDSKLARPVAPTDRCIHELPVDLVREAARTSTPASTDNLVGEPF
jgi:hypothetical protein